MLSHDLGDQRTTCEDTINDGPSVTAHTDTSQSHPHSGTERAGAMGFAMRRRSMRGPSRPPAGHETGADLRVLSAGATWHSRADEWRAAETIGPGSQSIASDHDPSNTGSLPLVRGRALLGRDRELGEIGRFLDGAHERGRALVVWGEAGIGKSAVLSTASLIAGDRGMSVVSTSGVRSEIDLPFAGLHQLMRPWLGQLERLPPLQRNAISAAFGISGSAAPEPFMIALAALELLGEAASRTPLVLVVDDAHWLDRPTADVLAFVGRRLDSDPIALLAVIREGYESPLLGAGLPQLHVDRFSEPAARQLLDQHYPQLTPNVRGRVLETAGGNPLALLELPLTLASDRGPVGSPNTVPLTARLESAFASRAAELPTATRTLLRIAAADERATLAEVIAAAEVAFGTCLTVEDLVPATDARLIDLDVTELRFRHPLMSSAVYQAASVAERHAAHAALAEILRDPDRQVWHRAAATVGTDLDVASELEAMARRVHKRGANIVAAAAFERAAALTRDPTERAQLVLSAAQAAAELGRSEIVLHLVREARAAELGLRERALAMWLEDGLETGPVGDPARVSALARAARERVRARDIDLALSLALSAAFRCYMGNLGEDAARAVLDVADAIEVPPDDPRRLQILGYAAPIERGLDVIAHLPDSVPAGDPLALSRIGTAASQVGAYGRAASLLGAAAVQLREQGRLRALAEVLLHRAWSAIQTADYTVAVAAGEEAERLASETAQPALQTAAWTAQAFLAALRGERGLVEELTEAVERSSLPAGAAAVLALAQYARGLAALGQGLHEQAYEQLRRIYQLGDPSHHHGPPPVPWTRFRFRDWTVGGLSDGRP